MAKQTLVFESPIELTLKGGMIVITDRKNGEITMRSLEDVQMVMVDNHSVRLSVPLLTKMATLNIGVVFCDEKHMPVTMLMDFESNSIQSGRFQCQLAASKPLKKQIWKQIVEAKIRNQSMLLEKMNLGKATLAVYYNNVKSGDSTNREGVAAKIYWKKLMGPNFIRDRNGANPNSLLNYGYAVLRSMVARHLMNAGLLPIIGVFHHNCYDAFPLADDVMEPYRPFVDYRVKKLNEEGIASVCREAKRQILDLFYEDLPADALMKTASTLAGVYEGNGRVVVFPEI